MRSVAASAEVDQLMGDGERALQACLVGVVTKSSPVGLGFYVGRQYLCTCAHVVYAALGRTWKDGAAQKSPKAHETIAVQFPFLEPGRKWRARVADWDGHADRAILKLMEPPPAGAFPVRLLGTGDALGEEYLAFGYPTTAPGGIWSEGKVTHLLPDGSAQLVGDKTQGHAVVAGFSGTPVWIPSKNGVAAMVARAADKTSALALATSVQEYVTAALHRLHPDHRPGVSALVRAFADADPAGGQSAAESFVAERLALSSLSPFPQWQRHMLSLSHWLAHPASPFALVLGEEYWGKSTLLCQWLAHVASAEQAQVIYVPVLRELGTDRRRGFLRVLAAGLGITPGPEGESDPDALMQEIHQALGYRPHDTTLLVVDGLSEMADWDWAGLPQPLFPAVPDPRVKILVAVRPLDSDGKGGEWLKRLNWPWIRPHVLELVTESDWFDMLANASPRLTYFREERQSLLRYLYQNSFGGNYGLLHNYLRALMDLGHHAYLRSDSSIAQHVAAWIGRKAPEGPPAGRNRESTAPPALLEGPPAAPAEAFRMLPSDRFSPAASPARSWWPWLMFAPGVVGLIFLLYLLWQATR